MHVQGRLIWTDPVLNLVGVLDQSEPFVGGVKEALFIAWLKRTGGGRTLATCRKKLGQLGLSEDVLESLPSDRICIQRQRGEEYLRLKDRRWADRLAMEQKVKVPHHGQYIYVKKNLR
jgi:hypothetical protein